MTTDKAQSRATATSAPCVGQQVALSGGFLRRHPKGGLSSDIGTL
ncbi:MAG: hypothetical protein PUP90_02125 [Nostoc sp. S4]|nr:hypothetical protein [Nostoc sp. S4]